MAFDVLLRDVGQRLDLLELKLIVGVEQKQDAHLVGAHLQFMLGTLLAQDGLHVGEARVVFPCQQSACVLVGVELVEVADAGLDLFGQDDHERVVLSFVGPVACGEHLHAHFESQLLRQLRAFELYHCVLRHLDVFKHDFQLLGELEAALFLQLLHQQLLRVFIGASLFQKSLGQRVLVETFEDIFVLQISENVDDLVQDVVDFLLLHPLEVLLELLV